MSKFTGEIILWGDWMGGGIAKSPDLKDDFTILVKREDVLAHENEYVRLELGSKIKFDVEKTNAGIKAVNIERVDNSD